MTSPPSPTLARELGALRLKYETAEALALDPLSVPRSFADPGDREIAAWVASHLAYGKVAPMLRAIREALAPLGPRPAAWLRDRTAPAAARSLRGALGTWVWRFHTAEDLVQWILAWKRLDSGGGLEAALLAADRGDGDAALSALVNRLRRELPPTHGLRFSLPDPLEGAACKRWRLFLRWMVRRGWPDLGDWRRHSPAHLVIPLDTHVARVSRFIGLTARRTPDARMAREITEALRCLDPADPLGFDFALSHLGIMGDCPGVRSLPRCSPCPLVDVCRAGE